MTKRPNVSSTKLAQYMIQLDRAFKRVEAIENARARKFAPDRVRVSR